MWFHELNFRRVVPVLTVMSVAALSGCGVGDEGTGRTTQMRCAQDGLCVEAVGQNSLEMGFRDGAKEVRLDCIYRRHSAQLHSNRPFACRILDEYGDTFSEDSGGDRPVAWGAPRQGLQRSARPMEETLDVRDALVRGMEAAVCKGSKPPEIADSAWQEAAEQLKYMTQAMDAAGNTDRLGANSTEDAPSSLFLVEETERDAAVVEGSESDEEIQRDEFEAHTAAEGDDVDRIGAGADIWAGRTGEDVFFRSFQGLKKENIDFSYHEKNPWWEYKQEIDLWNLNTKTFFFFGWPSKKHHSAAEIWLFRRPIGSQQPFALYARSKTGNHGSKPHDKRMHLYARCRNFPVTKGYFSWKGECDGRWLTGHLCNDDTAYQIWHAYGGWNGGRHCVGKKRTHRPSCDKPW